MAFLVIVLALLRRIPAGVDAVARGLLRAMPLFFVPAGVGVLTLSDTFRRDWLPIVVALVGSTVFALAVTALAARAALALARRRRR
jgi:holin-like protein